jgi:hypothetical protein
VRQRVAPSLGHRLGFLLGGASLVFSVWAGGSPALAAPLVERAVVRFTAPELGGVVNPRFVFERELAFEARLEALAEPSFAPSDELPYRTTHVKAALERHIAETILESLPCSPAPSSQEIELRVLSARQALAQRVGGQDRVIDAARREGLAAREVFRFLQRQARASIYLDRMVAPMLEPTSAELQALHQSGRTPFSRQDYETVREPLRSWVVSSRLRAAVVSYYEAARTRLNLHVIPKPER